MAERTADIAKIIAAGGKPNQGHIKALEEAGKRLNNALAKAKNQCGEGVTILVVLVAAAEAAQAAAAAILLAAAAAAA